MDIGYTKDHLGKDIIVIKPFEYICRWCGEEIPEGDLHGSCKACSIKNTKNVY